MASFDMAMSGQTSQPKQKSYSKVLHTKRMRPELLEIFRQVYP